MSVLTIAKALAQNGMPALVPRAEIKFPRRGGRRVRTAGVYVLAFTDGSYYVGETLDFAARLHAHEKRFHDIAQVALLPIKRTAGWKQVLRTIEREKLWALHSVLEQHGIRSRCIKGPRSLVPRDFDEILAEGERDGWYAGEDLQLGDDQRQPDAHELDKYAKRFNDFRTRCGDADAIASVVNHYARSIVPRPWRGEAWFWNASCMPGSGILVRFNVGWQTTLDIFGEQGEAPEYHLYLTEHLAQQLDPSFRRGSSKRLRIQGAPGGSAPLSFKTIPIDLVKGGPDQVALCTEGPEMLHRAFDTPLVRASLRQFAGGLMQQDSCPWGESHCWQLMQP
jgi:hypothetical protein